MDAFVSYVLDFYGQRGLYKEFFDEKDGVGQAEVEAALAIRKKHNDPPFSGDSFDRELVRDIMLAKRGETELEYPVVIQWVKESITPQ